MASAASDQKKVKVGLCQMLVGADKAKNLAAAAEAVASAAKGGAQLVMLPEMFQCPYSNDSFPVYCESIPFDGSRETESVDPQKHPSSHALVAMAKKHNIWLIGGSFPETEGGKLYNTCLVLDPAGKIVAKHRKVHLFDINIPGKQVFKESDTLSPGNSFTVFDAPFGKVGVGICYDIRFPEYAQICAQQGAVIMAYPGAFNTTTGPAHWELLQRARALDQQMYVLTCSPARNPESKYQAWGHSTVVGPWGDVQQTTEHGPALVLAELDLPRVQEVRSQIPVRMQKRTDMYGVVSKQAEKQ